MTNVNSKNEKDRRKHEFQLSLASRVKKAIKKSEISQAEICRDLGYNQSLFSQYLDESTERNSKGEYVPRGKPLPAYMIKDIAEYLHVPIASFFYDKDELAEQQKAPSGITYRQLAEFLLDLLDQAESQFVVEEDRDETLVTTVAHVSGICDEAEFAEDDLTIHRANLHIYHPEIVNLLSNRRKIKSVDALPEEIYKQWLDGALSKVPDTAVKEWNDLQQWGFKSAFNHPLHSISSSDVWDVIENSNTDQEPDEYIGEVFDSIKAIDNPF